jgi:hypothetical protein
LVINCIAKNGVSRESQKLSWESKEISSRLQPAKSKSDQNAIPKYFNFHLSCLIFKTTKFKFLFCEDKDILMILNKKSFQLLKGLSI